MLVEEPIPRKRRATAEGGQEVVGPEERRGTDGEHCERDILRDIRLAVDEFLFFTVLHEVAEAEAQ